MKVLFCLYVIPQSCKLALNRWNPWNCRKVRWLLNSSYHFKKSDELEKQHELSSVYRPISLNQLNIMLLVKRLTKNNTNKMIMITALTLKKKGTVQRGEEGQPQQFLVRDTFSSFSRPSHLGILVLWLFCVNKFSILEDKTIFLKMWMD